MLNVKKRDGSVVPFELSKISDAIQKAFVAEHKHFTDEMIEAYDHTYYSIKHSIYCEGLNSSNIVGELEKFDNSYVKVRSKKLSGVYLCNVYLGDGEMVNFSIKSSVAKGNFKILGHSTLSSAELHFKGKLTKKQLLSLQKISFYA